MKPVLFRTLAAFASVALALPAAAQYAGFKASIVKQLSPANPRDDAIVELVTLIPRKYELRFNALNVPPGVAFKGLAGAGACSIENGARCRQYFTMAVDAGSSGKCNLDGSYVARFDVACVDPKDVSCKPGTHDVGFTLKSENFCAEKAVSTAAFWTRIGGVFAADVGSGGGDFLMWFLDAGKAGNGGFDVASLGYDKAAAMRRGARAMRIDVDEQGGAVIVNDRNEIFRFIGGTWQALPGKAVDIGIGANGALWRIGTDAVAGGFGIWRWLKDGWVAVPGAAVRIDVDPQGNAWVINDAGNIFRWTGGGWGRVPGLARDIGIGNRGAVFIAGADGIVYQWDTRKNNWESRGGANVTDITVDSDGAPVVVNKNREVWVGQP